MRCTQKLSGGNRCHRQIGNGTNYKCWQHSFSTSQIGGGKKLTFVHQTVVPNSLDYKQLGALAQALEQLYPSDMIEVLRILRRNKDSLDVWLVKEKNKIKGSLILATSDQMADYQLLALDAVDIKPIVNGTITADKKVSPYALALVNKMKSTLKARHDGNGVTVINKFRSLQLLRLWRQTDFFAPHQYKGFIHFLGIK